MKIFLGGINGAGKTTILHRVELLSPNIKIAHGSREYMRFLGLKPNSYDRLRALPEAEHKVMLSNFITSSLQTVSSSETFIFDGHFVVFDQGESPIIKISDWIKKFDVMVLVEADARDIYKRIRNDHESGVRTRTYNLNSSKKDVIDELNYRLTFARNIAHRCSEWFEVPLLTVNNRDSILATKELLTKVGEGQ